jgi:spore coat polysaccharide biosynthesis protein SpsF (cytidylyltransferase family)
METLPKVSPELESKKQKLSDIIESHIAKCVEYENLKQEKTSQSSFDGFRRVLAYNEEAIEIILANKEEIFKVRSYIKPAIIAGTSEDLEIEYFDTFSAGQTINEILYSYFVNNSINKIIAEEKDEFYFPTNPIGTVGSNLELIERTKAEIDRREDITSNYKTNPTLFPNTYITESGNTSLLISAKNRLNYYNWLLDLN